MSQYIFILVWIAAMFFLKSVMSGGYRVENILGKKEYRVSWGFAAFAFCPVVIMATFRGDRKEKVDTKNNSLLLVWGKSQIKSYKTVY